MKINAIQNCYLPNTKSNVKTNKPNFGKIKVVPTYWDSFERVLTERNMYKLQAIREDLTKFYIDCCSYYNMHLSVPTILEMLKSPKEYEVSVDYLHMYM